MTDENDIALDMSGTGGSFTYPRDCWKLRKYEHAMIGGRPCTLVDIRVMDTLVHLCGVDLVTGLTVKETMLLGCVVQVPHVRRRDYRLLGVDDSGSLSLRNEAGDVRSDLKCPESRVGEEIRQGVEAGRELICTVLDACGVEAVVSVKSDPEN